MRIYAHYLQEQEKFGTQKHTVHICLTDPRTVARATEMPTALLFTQQAQLITEELTLRGASKEKPWRDLGDITGMSGRKRRQEQ